MEKMKEISLVILVIFIIGCSSNSRKTNNVNSKNNFETQKSSENKKLPMWVYGVSSSEERYQGVGSSENKKEAILKALGSLIDNEEVHLEHTQTSEATLTQITSRKKIGNIEIYQKVEQSIGRESVKSAVTIEITDYNESAKGSKIKFLIRENSKTGKVSKKMESDDDFNFEKVIEELKESGMDFKLFERDSVYYYLLDIKKRIVKDLEISTLTNSKELIQAIKENNITKVKDIIENGTDVNYIVEEGELEGASPLMIAIANKNEEVVEFLLKKAPEINYTIEKGKFKGFSLLGFALEENLEIAKLLIEKSSNRNFNYSINIGGYGYLTPLVFGSASNYKELVMLLINKGADVNYAVDEGKFKGLLPLSVAVENSSEIAKMLIEKGAKVNYTIKVGNYEGVSPLIAAIDLERKELTRLLIEEGADINSLFKVGEFKGMTPLLIAVMSQDKELVKLLIDRGANINYAIKKDGYTITPFGIALDDNLDLAKLLIERGVNLNYIMGVYNFKGVTPLIATVRYYDKKLVEFLINNDADVNGIDKYGNSPLMYAAGYNEFEKAILLIENGANINVRNDDGMTAMDIAMERGHPKMVKFLKKAEEQSQNSNKKGSVKNSMNIE